MKKLFIKIAKDSGCDILAYKSYRSDMGCQVFDIVVRTSNGIARQHSDSYFIGEDGGKQKVIDYFKNTFIPALTLLSTT